MEAMEGGGGERLAALTLEQALLSEERKRRKNEKKNEDGEVEKDEKDEDEERTSNSNSNSSSRGSSGRSLRNKTIDTASLSRKKKKKNKGSKKTAAAEDEEDDGGEGEGSSSRKKSSKKKKKGVSKDEDGATAAGGADHHQQEERDGMQSGGSSGKKTKTKTKRKNLKALTLASTLPNVRTCEGPSSPSSESNPTSPTGAGLFSSSGKISLVTKAKSSDAHVGALRWSDLPDTPVKKKTSGGSSSSKKKKKTASIRRRRSNADEEAEAAAAAGDEDVEEWERTGSSDMVPCTIGHFKQLSLSASDEQLCVYEEGGGDGVAGDKPIPVDDDDDVLAIGDADADGDGAEDDDGDRSKESEGADEVERNKNERDLPAATALELSKLTLGGGGGGGGSAPVTSRTTSAGAKCAQLKTLRSMEPTVVWRSLQQLKTTAQSPDADGGRAERKKRTEMLWRELIDTEINYVNNLNTIIQEFVIPLTTLANEGKGALTPGQVDLIFSRVTPLHAIHEALLAEFKRAEAGGCTFSDAFLTFMPFLKVYSTYVNKHPSAIELLIKLQRSSSRFRKFLDECMNKTGMDVESFLILPIQRLPRYELILNDLVRQTMMCSAPAEYEKLKRLLASIKEINTAVVESRKREESAERMYHIYASLVFPSKQKELDVFDETIRVFVKEGMLDVCLPPDSTFVPRCFILFTDILICTVKKGSTMKFEYFFKLANINPQSTGQKLTSLFGDDNVFALADRKKSNNGGSRGSRGSRAGKTSSAAETNDSVLYLRASSAEEKDAWITELEQLCTRAQVAEAKKARRSITLPNLKDMLDAELQKEREGEEEEEASTKAPSTTEKRKSRRLSLRYNTTLLKSKKPNT